MADDVVVVVAARNAWPEYLQHHAYVCQRDRPFGAATRMAFYAEGAIQPLVPRMQRWTGSLTFTFAAAEAHRSRGGDARTGDLIDRLLRAGPRVEGESFGVMLLSAPDDDDTVTLAAPIINDHRSPAGKRVAWTRWQRYSTLRALTSGATTTSQL